ncbi:MAG: TolC family protein, partial [Cloacibacillus sp.]
MAVNYISLRTLQERLTIANYNLGLQMSTVEIQQSKVDSGLSDSLALKQAQYTMQQTKASIPNIEA